MKYIMCLHYVVVFMVLLLLEACNPVTSHQTLSYFFDGVPVPEKHGTVVVTQKQGVEQPTQVVPSKDAGQENHLAVSFHPDFKDKACDKCHDVEHSNRLKHRQPELCYQCHKSFETRYKKLHGPVAAGFCSTCHDSHKSEHKALLKMPIRKVCQHCHEPGDVGKNEAHSAISTVECLTCHNSHGGDSRNMLRGDYQKNEK